MVHLQPDGFLIAAVPNLAHGSQRLSLLDGAFPIRRGQLRFYTLRELEQVFLGAGLMLDAVERVVLDPFRDPLDGAQRWTLPRIPEAIQHLIERDPEAAVAEYVVRARSAPAEEIAARRAVLVASEAEGQPAILLTATERELLAQPFEEMRGSLQRAEERARAAEQAAEASRREAAEANEHAEAARGALEAERTRAEDRGRACSELEHALAVAKERSTDLEAVCGQRSARFGGASRSTRRLATRSSADSRRRRPG